MIIAAPGDEVSMLLATVYLQASDAPLLDGTIWQEISKASELPPENRTVTEATI
ncbi:MAG: hypothetical protein ACK5LJ_09105 [Paracoccus sp. (in: a-proteobacteria)]